MRTPLKLLFLSSALTLMIACGGDDGSNDSATTTSASGATVVSFVDQPTTTSEVSEQVPTNTDLPALGECPMMVFPDLSDVAGPGG
ncbi:MAG: hypothetical protein EB037_13030, partial [Actinobacteria bacterium]|nr:hypothetical protein [Actinomycetota bacterium]